VAIAGLVQIFTKIMALGLVEVFGANNVSVKVIEIGTTIVGARYAKNGKLKIGLKLSVIGEILTCATETNAYSIERIIVYNFQSGLKNQIASPDCG
jgi:hypothetical protein